MTLLGAVPSPDRPHPTWLACSPSTPQRRPLQIPAFSHQSSWWLLQLSWARRPVSLPKGRLASMALSLPAHTLHKHAPPHSSVHTHTPSPHACAYSTPTRITHTHLHVHTQNHRLTPAWAHHTTHSHTLMTQAPCDPCMTPV